MFNNEKNNFFEEELKQSQALTSESESCKATCRKIGRKKRNG